MSSSSTRTAESCRQNRSPSGKRVKHRGQTFTCSSSLTEPRLHEGGKETVVDRALTLGRLDVEERELEADIELLVRRELEAASDRYLERTGGRIEIGNAKLRKQNDREGRDRVRRDADRWVEVRLRAVADG